VDNSIRKVGDEVQGEVDNFVLAYFAVTGVRAAFGVDCPIDGELDRIDSLSSFWHQVNLDAAFGREVSIMLDLLQLYTSNSDKYRLN